ETFDKEDEATELNDALDASIDRATKAYAKGDTVMAVIVSGGDMGYVAPGEGRTFGPVFDIMGLEPALEVEDSGDDHQGDDVSVEAIAKSNADWLLGIDRHAAAAAHEDGYTTARQLRD